MSSVSQCCRGKQLFSALLSAKISTRTFVGISQGAEPPFFPHGPCFSLDHLSCNHQRSCMVFCTSLRGASSSIIHPPRMIVVRATCAKFLVLGKGCAQPPSFHPRVRAPIFDHIVQLCLCGTKYFPSAHCHEPNVPEQAANVPSFSPSTMALTYFSYHEPYFLVLLYTSLYIDEDWNQVFT